MRSLRLYCKRTVDIKTGLPCAERLKMDSCKTHHLDIKWNCAKCNTPLCSECQAVSFQNKIYCYPCSEEIDSKATVDETKQAAPKKMDLITLFNIYRISLFSVLIFVSLTFARYYKNPIGHGYTHGIPLSGWQVLMVIVLVAFCLKLHAFFCKHLQCKHCGSRLLMFSSRRGRNVSINMFLPRHCPSCGTVVQNWLPF